MVNDNLPEDFTTINVEHFSSELNDQYFFFAFMSAWNIFPGTTPYLVITDNYGTPVYFKRFEGDVMDFKVQPNGYLSYYENDARAHFVMDHNFEVIEQIEYMNHTIDFHDFHILEDGTYLLLGLEMRLINIDTVVPGGHENVTVGNTHIQIQDTAQNVLFQWSGWDHFEITDTYDDLFSENYIDVAHTKALEFDDDGCLLMSNRNMYEITKIDTASGEIIWRLGGKNNQFTYTGLDTLGFTGQHDIRKTPGGLYQIFDNGWQMEPPFSSALQLDLDEENKIAHVVKRLRSQPDDIMGWIMGSAQKHEDGRVVVGWGDGNPNITEFDANDNKIVEFSYEAASYRAFKFDWETTAFDFDDEMLEFADVQPGGIITDSIIITNNLSYDIEINNIVSRTGFFTPGESFPFTIAAGESRAINVDFIGDSIGFYQDLLTICSDLDNDTLTRRIAKQIPATVNVTEDASINEHIVQFLKVYPNPASGKMTIENFTTEKTHYLVTTLQGEVLKKFSSDAKNLSIDLSDLPMGIYILKAEYSAGLFTHTKIVKQ